MKTDSILPPFRFNPWKHHLHWVQDRLHQINLNPSDSLLRSDLIKNISSINSNYDDIYIGLTSPEQIVQCIYDELIYLGIKDNNSFLTWIKQDGYKLVTLPDNSVWVLREGNEGDSCIHIHPARNAPMVVRIHGNSWKTIIVSLVLFPGLGRNDLKIMNDVRVDHLNLSPVKNVSGSPRLLKAFNLFANKNEYLTDPDHHP